MAEDVFLSRLSPARERVKNKRRRQSQIGSKTNTRPTRKQCVSRKQRGNNFIYFFYFFPQLINYQIAPTRSFCDTVFRQLFIHKNEDNKRRMCNFTAVEVYMGPCFGRELAQELNPSEYKTKSWAEEFGDGHQVPFSVAKFKTKTKIGK